jgi:spermidine/putrescine transport system substrate-binding protein
MVEGVIVGQTWDGPALALKSAGEPVMYRAALEGAMAWIDGMAIPVGAGNLDQAYAFIQHCYDAEAAGKAIDTHGYNSVVKGFDQHVSDSFKKNFADAYPGDAIEKLWVQGTERPWFLEKRQALVDKISAA